MAKKSVSDALRYSAKLLFQFRVVVGGKAGKRRLCEEQIIVLEAESAKDALTKAKRRGKQAEFKYKNAQGNPVYYEFIGVMELLDLQACDGDEVWYRLVERVQPSERKSILIPPESELNAIWNARRSVEGS